MLRTMIMRFAAARVLALAVSILAPIAARAGDEPPALQQQGAPGEAPPKDSALTRPNEPAPAGTIEPAPAARPAADGLSTAAPAAEELLARARAKLSFTIDCEMEMVRGFAFDRRERLIAIVGSRTQSTAGEGRPDDWEKGRYPGSVEIWDLATRKHVKTIVGPFGVTWSAAFSPDERQLLFGGRALNDAKRGYAGLWDLESGTLVREFGLQKRSVGSVVFSPDAQRIAIGGNERIPRLWNAASGELELELSKQSSDCDYLFFTPDSQRLIIAAFNGQVTIWHLASQSLQKKLKIDKAFLSAAALSPDGNVLAVGGHVDARVDPKANPSTKVVVWQLPAGKVVAEFDLEHWVNGLSFSPDGKWLAAHGLNHDILIWDWAQRSVYARIANTQRTSANRIKFLPVSGRLATSEMIGGVNIYELQDEPAAALTP